MWKTPREWALPRMGGAGIDEKGGPELLDPAELGEGSRGGERARGPGLRKILPQSGSRIGSVNSEARSRKSSAELMPEPALI